MKQLKKDQNKPIDGHLLATLMPDVLNVVSTSEEEQEVYELWVKTYKTIYPAFEVPKNDPRNAFAHIFYTRDQKNIVNSSIRLTNDSALGMPSEEYYPPEINMFRDFGYTLMEFGRMISTGDMNLLKSYHKLAYQVAKAKKVDLIIMTLKQKDVAFYHNMMGAYLLSEDMGIPHGGDQPVSTVAWDINNTKSRFFKWTRFNTQLEGELS